MGFFDALFGTKKESQVHKDKKKKKAITVERSDENVGSQAEQEINPEILAAIAASVNCVMESDDAALIAAVAAAIHHARSGGNLAIKIKRNNNNWAMIGRQKIMDSRQFA